MHKELRVTIEICLESGKMLLEKWPLCEIHHLKHKKEICTNLDLEAERMIINKLQTSFPHYNILSEEKGFINKKSDYTWVIDPIDGSRNYFLKLPFFNTTIALRHKNETTLGITYSPATKEFFHVQKKSGSFLTKVKNDFTLDKHTQKLSVSKETSLRQASLHIKFPTDSKQKNLLEKSQLLSCVRRIRSIGSVALALAYTAMGAYDGYIDLSHNTKLWDVATGLLLIQEAGGTISDLEGNPLTTSSGPFIAANPQIHKLLLIKT